ncbi:MAG: biosynthetic-type acetolactate synthase large subunit [Clostridiales bacterium]|nr:biosynthetic-type acetolactate synthase large subunit [Clostridiales bacterium]
MKLSGAEIVVETLIEQNVKTIFGYPGGTVIDIYDQLQKKNDRITHVLSAHEQGAAHAADGYARATGEIGVVLATSGPGATNLVTGIATAHLDSVPLLAITGNVSNSLIGRDSFQEIDISGVTLPITKHNFIVHDVNELADTLREAIRIAKSGRPGPVLVDIPKDIQQAKCEFNYKAPVTRTEGEPASEDMVHEAARMIADANRPYIYFGGGAVRAGAGALISELADKIDAVIGCSMMGLSELPSKLDRFLGMQGMHGHYASSKAMAKADLIIAVGVRFSDRATGDAQKFSAGARKIHIDVDAAEIGKNVKVNLGVSCDIADFLRKLIDMVDYKRNPNWMTKIEKLREQEKEQEITDFLPEQAIKAISEIVEDDTEIVTDVGQHQMWAAQYYDFKKKRTWISSGGLGTMGFGMGAAIGSSFGSGKRSVLVTGDGSFGMNLNELATAVAYNVPLTVVVFNNGVLGMVRQWQTLFYNKNYSNTTLTDRKTDFVKLAEAFGCEGYKATNEAEFREVFEKAYKTEGPSVVELIIDKDDMVFPMLRPGGSYDHLILDKEDKA